MQTTIIFDLDETLINSTHRKLNKPCGSIDLDHWRENCTAEKINGDTLLPKGVELYKNAKKMQTSVIACTARVMGKHDYNYLKNKGLTFDKILSRGNSTAGDAELKETLLRSYAKAKALNFKDFSKNAVMVDDNQKVLSHLASLGFATIDAIELNK